ncbi:MAG: hypothetical protein R2851_13690 [Caldilineaceae bacterium]
MAEGRDAAAAVSLAYSAQYEPVTAGVVDDNADWAGVPGLPGPAPATTACLMADAARAVIIHVIDDQEPRMMLKSRSCMAGRDVYNGRTDTAGRLIFLPRTLNTFRQQQKDEHRVTATKGWTARTQTFGRSDGDTWTLTIKDAPRGWHPTGPALPRRTRPVP